MKIEFMFRGLKFRELGPIGLQVRSEDGQWYDTDFVNRKTLEKITGIPDISLWKDRHVVGNLRFKEDA